MKSRKQIRTPIVLIFLVTSSSWAGADVEGIATKLRAAVGQGYSDARQKAMGLDEPEYQELDALLRDTVDGVPIAEIVRVRRLLPHAARVFDDQIEQAILTRQRSSNATHHWVYGNHVRIVGDADAWLTFEALMKLELPVLFNNVLLYQMSDWTQAQAVHGHALAAVSRRHADVVEVCAGVHKVIRKWQRKPELIEGLCDLLLERYSDIRPHEVRGQGYQGPGTAQILRTVRQMDRQRQLTILGLFLDSELTIAKAEFLEIREWEEADAAALIATMSEYASLTRAARRGQEVDPGSSDRLHRKLLTMKRQRQVSQRWAYLVECISDLAIGAQKGPASAPNRDPPG